MVISLGKTSTFNDDWPTGSRQICLFIFLIVFNIQGVVSHGRLIEPPSRASAWRYGFNTPPDYNDHELYCGGFTRQWKRNDGKCGECGDAWDMPKPRPHEHGGQWGQGVIVRNYTPGAEIPIRVELTASHMGYFEFRLCPDPNADQECLDRNLLQILGGAPSQPNPGDLETRFYPRNGSRIYEIKAQLPDLKCSHCVLQWRYVAGNNWGLCPNGNGAVGCGPQEEFRSCSDIALGDELPKPIRPIRPTLRTTVRPKVHTNTTEPTKEEELPEGFDYVPLLLIAIFLLVASCLFIIWYLNRKNNPVVKRWVESLHRRLYREHVKRPDIAASRVPSASIFAIPKLQSFPKIVDDSNGSSSDIPVPPPRLKRQARLKEMSPGEPSVA